MLKVSSDPSAPARIVVLGAGGFLGRHAVPVLQGIAGAVLTPSARELDLSAPEATGRLVALLQPRDTLLFLSAVTPDKGRDGATLIRNLQMARTVCLAAERVKLGHLVYAASDAVYGWDEEQISEATPAVPTDLYGAMHRTRELMLSAEAPAPLAVLRFTAVYGEQDTHNAYGPNRFIRQARKEGRIKLFGDGEDVRDHLYIADAVDVLRRVVIGRAEGLSNVASGVSTSFRDLAEVVAAHVPGTVIEAGPRAQPATRRRFAPSAAQSAFPDLYFTPLTTGISTVFAPEGAR